MQRAECVHHPLVAQTRRYLQEAANLQKLIMKLASTAGRGGPLLNTQPCCACTSSNLLLGFCACGRAGSRSLTWHRTRSSQPSLLHFETVLQGRWGTEAGVGARVQTTSRHTQAALGAAAAAQQAASRQQHSRLRTWRVVWVAATAGGHHALLRTPQQTRTNCSTHVTLLTALTWCSC
jgi:hypothetical protein